MAAATGEGRFGHELTPLAGGDLLVTGGATFTDNGSEVPLSSVERYRPAGDAATAARRSARALSFVATVERIRGL